jgi:hypothetical protein
MVNFTITNAVIKCLRLDCMTAAEIYGEVCMAMTGKVYATGRLGIGVNGQRSWVRHAI